MQEYVTEFFEYFGCTMQQDGAVLVIAMTPELAEYFGKPRLRLVFDSRHAAQNAELVTPGSYLAHRMYDLLKQGEKTTSVILPKRREFSDIQTAIVPYRSALTNISKKETFRTETYITFRVTYFAHDKIEELLTIGIDYEGNVREHVEFPYMIADLERAVSGEFPLTKKQAKELYNACVAGLQQHVQERALRYQKELAQQYYADIMRLEGFYQQMIEEIPLLANQRESSVRQLQQEYQIKVADELRKCQIHSTIEPVTFCAVTMPFYQYQLTLQSATSKSHKAKIRAYHNLFSGAWQTPRCESCGKAMREIGVCDAASHAVCRECLGTCEECGTQVCQQCGLEQCPECGKQLCHQCSTLCHLCGKRSCHEHTLGCRLCHAHFCVQCAAACDECGSVVEKNHLTACEICQQRICPHCTFRCVSCQREVGRTHQISCAFCGQQICGDCAFQCDICGKMFCAHHIHECDLTRKMVCPYHVGKKPVSRRQYE